MTGPELRAARMSMGMTQLELARALGRGDYAWQSISKWENGRKPVPGDVAAAVRLLIGSVEK